MFPATSATEIASLSLHDALPIFVSFQRVFEVLDLQPLVAEAPNPTEVPDGPLSIEFDGVGFGYPSPDQVSLASLEEVAVLDSRGGAQVLHDVSFRAEPRSEEHT